MPKPETLSLGPNEAVSERPFTAIELIDRDVSIMHGMLDDVVRVLGESDLGVREIVPLKRIAWREDRRARRLVVCDEERLKVHHDLCVVGFFGERRTEMDVAPLEEANAAIVAQFKNYPGILSYSSMELPDGYWANMVLHDDPVDREYWNRSALHAQAARILSPIHYRTVRIHNARLTASVLERPSFVLMRTKYWDYSGDDEWAAERVLVS